MKKDAIAFAAALAVMSLSGCSNKNNSIPGNNSNNNSSEQTGVSISEDIPEAEIHEFEIEKFIDFPEMNFINDMEYKNDRIYLSGVRDSETRTIFSFYMTDISGSEKRELSFKEIPSPDYVLPVSDGVVCFYHNSGPERWMALCDPNTGKTLKSTKCSYDGYISNILLSECGNIVVINHDYTALYSSSSDDSSVNVTADIYSPDLEFVRSLDLMEICGNDYGSFGDIIISGERLICQSLVESEEKTNAVIYEISLADGSVEDSYEFNEDVVSSGMFIDSAGELCIVPDIFSGMYEDFTYYKFDTTERTFSKYTEELSDVQKFRSGNEQYDLIYISNEDGTVCGYSFGSHEKTVISGIGSDTAIMSGIDNDTDIYVNAGKIIVSDASYSIQNNIVCCSMNTDGSDRQYSLYEFDNGGSGFTKLCTDSKGDMYAFASLYQGYFAEDDTDISAGDRHLLYHYSKVTGKLVTATDLSEEIGSGEAVTADWMSVDDKGNVCLVYHTDGTLGLDRTFILITDITGDIVLHESVAGSCNSAYYSSESGKLIIAGFDGIEIFSIDAENGTVGDPEKTESLIRGERVIKIYPGDGEYDFYCADIRELYGFRTEENICDKVFSRDYSYDHSYDVTMFCPVSDGKLFCQAFDAENRSRLCLISPKADTQE